MSLSPAMSALAGAVAVGDVPATVSAWLDLEATERDALVATAQGAEKTPAQKFASTVIGLVSAAALADAAPAVIDAIESAARAVCLPRRTIGASGKNPGQGHYLAGSGVAGAAYLALTYKV